MSDAETLKDALEAFDLVANSDAETANRAEALDDLRFARLNEQWPDKMRKAREDEGRPCLTINKLPAFIRQVVNDSRQNRPSITVHPVDSDADPETAEIMSGLIRNIETISNADVAYDTGIDFAVSSGIGYWRVNLDYACDDTFEQDIIIKAIANPFSVYGDPHSEAADSSDWMTAFVVDQIPRAQFKRKYKSAKETDWNSAAWNGAAQAWLDEKTVRVAEYWTREEVTTNKLLTSDGRLIDEKSAATDEGLMSGLVTIEGQPRPVRSHKVKQIIMSGAEVLSTIDWAGRYIPIVPVYGDEVNVEGRRYFRSLIRDAKDPQRMFNYWRTTATEVVALAPRAPFIGRKGAFETDAAKWATANSASHAYIEFDGPEAPQRQPFAGVPAGMIQEALNASDDMKAVMGLYDASLGARSNETSGRAITARQREGDVSTFHFIDNLTRSIRHTGKILIDLIPKVYNTERVIRVLGPDATPRPVKVNQQTEEVDDKGNPKKGPDGNPIMRIYDLRAGKYDLTVKSGPSFTTRREEAANQMIELLRAFPDAAPVIGDLLAKNLDWPGADEIAKRLHSMLPPEARGDEGDGDDPKVAQMQQQMQMLGQALQQATQAVEQAKTDRTLEERKLDIAEYDAETKRMTALATGLSPTQLNAVVTDLVNDLLSEHGLEMPAPLPGELTPPNPGEEQATEPQGQPDA